MEIQGSPGSGAFLSGGKAWEIFGGGRSPQPSPLYPCAGTRGHPRGLELPSAMHCCAVPSLSLAIPFLSKRGKPHGSRALGGASC